MATITKEEFLKIIRISNIEVTEEEIPALISHVDAILSYAAKVKELAEGPERLMDKEQNIFRPDEVHVTASQPLLAQAPVQEQNYFVVPTIIQSK